MLCAAGRGASVRDLPGEVRATCDCKAYFFSMGQVWDFLDVVMEKLRQAMEACVAAMEELKPVKQADSECLQKRYKESRAIEERANIEGVYTHLLTEAVANKILSSLPPKEKELAQSKMARLVYSPPCGQPAATVEPVGVYLAVATATAAGSASSATKDRERRDAW
jgi:hypothetical protein